MENKLFQPMTHDSYANDDYLKQLLEEVALNAFISHVHHDQVVRQYEEKINAALDAGDEKAFHYYVERFTQYERTVAHV